MEVLSRRTVPCLGLQYPYTNPEWNRSAKRGSLVSATKEHEREETEPGRQTRHQGLVPGAPSVTVYVSDRADRLVRRLRLPPTGTRTQGHRCRSGAPGIPGEEATGSCHGRPRGGTPAPSSPGAPTDPPPPDIRRRFSSPTRPRTPLSLPASPSTPGLPVLPPSTSRILLSPSFSSRPATGSAPSPAPA